MAKGKFIVIDGTDGSGKGTQTELLIERLKKEKVPVFKADFPQYGNKSAGLIENYLNGKYGSAEEVGPYRASIFYAADRYDASLGIRKALAEGKIVIANRYVTANMAHQGGKIKDQMDRRDFFAWLEHLEYNTFGIPRSDLNLILHVKPEVAQRLVGTKEKRNYIEKGDKDIHEADLDHLRQAEQVYLEISEIMPNAKLIECCRQGDIMTRAAISDLIWEQVKPLIK